MAKRTDKAGTTGVMDLSLRMFDGREVHVRAIAIVRESRPRAKSKRRAPKRGRKA